ncbi:hypothetical protein ACLESO_09550 [Pyxidicoccus sp. 3LG]
MLRKSLVSSLLTLGLTFAPALAAAGEGQECSQGKLSAQTVVDKHLAAVGGKERLKAAKTFQLTVLAKEGDTATTINVQRVRPNLVRYDLEKNGVKTTKAFDGTQGWMAEGSAAPQRLEKEKSAKMAEGALFDDALLDPKARGVALELAGQEDVNGAPAFKLVLTRGADTETRFIDQKSFLEVKRTYAGTHEGKAYTKSVAFSDYRSVDGIMVSHKASWEADGKKGEKVTQSARYDAPINAAAFKFQAPRS